MNSDTRPTLLAIRNVPWETLHRILDSCDGLEVRHVCPLEGDPLPPHDDVAGILVMGGPMNVDETERHPGLATTRDYLAEAVRREMPVLGICLGARLLARVLGAAVVPGERRPLPPEADFALVDQWMATPEMSEEAIEALGEARAAEIAPEAAELEPALIAATTPGFQAFAALVRDA